MNHSEGGPVMDRLFAAIGEMSTLRFALLVVAIFVTAAALSFPAEVVP